MRTLLGLERRMGEWAPDSRTPAPARACTRCGRPILVIQVDGSDVTVEAQGEHRIALDASVQYLDGRDRHVGRVTRVHAVHCCGRRPV